MWIVRKNDIRKDPDVVSDRRMLADVDVAMKADVLTDYAVTLDVA